MCLFFHSDLPIFVGPGAAGLLTADLNSDGLPDVAVLDTSSHQVAVLTGNGHGGFASAVPVQLGGAPSAGAVATFPDGHATVYVPVGHLGEVDAITANGQGGFSVQQYPNELPPGQNLLAVAALNGNDTPVLVAANAPTQSLIIGGQSPIAIPGAPIALASGDLTGNGASSVVVATGDRILVYRGDGHGSVQAPQTFLGAVGPKSVITASLTGGPGNDIVVTSVASYGPYGAKYDTVSVLPNNGAAGFGPPVETFVDASFLVFGKHVAPAVAAGNFTGTHGDLVVTDAAGVYVLLGDGHGGFRQEIPVFYASPTAGSVPVSVAVTTLAPGGRPDIIVDYTDGSMRVIHTKVHPFGSPYSPISGSAANFGGIEVLLGLSLSVAVRSSRRLIGAARQPDDTRADPPVSPARG